MKRSLNTIVTLLIVTLSVSFISTCSKIDKPHEQQKTVEKQTKQSSMILHEKTILSNSYFGDFSNSKKEKIKGGKTLEVWQPHIQYSNTLPAHMRDVLLEGTQKLDVDYDEIWTWENEEGLTPAEVERFKRFTGKNNIYRLYWKQGMVQAATIEKYYTGNPYIGRKLSKPSHKIVRIYSRDFILDKVQE